MLTFSQIRNALQSNKTRIASGAVKLNDISISGVQTLGVNQEVWVMPIGGGQNIKVQPNDVLNVDPAN
jgi:hypothetical protein